MCLKIKKNLLTFLWTIIFVMAFNKNKKIIILSNILLSNRMFNCFHNLKNVKGILFVISYNIKMYSNAIKILFFNFEPWFLFKIQIKYILLNHFNR